MTLCRRPHTSPLGGGGRHAGRTPRGRGAGPAGSWGAPGPWAWTAPLPSCPRPISMGAGSAHPRVRPCRLPCVSSHVWQDRSPVRPRAGLWGWNVALAGRQLGACRPPSDMSCPPRRSRSGATSSGPTTMSCRSCARARPPAPSSCTCVPRAPR